MEVMAQVLEVDVVHPRNGRTYSAEVMAAAVDKFQRHLIRNEEAIPGEAHPPPEELAEFLNMANCSHVVRAIHIEHGRVIAKLKLINKYNELSRFGVRFRGVIRTVDFDEKGLRMINRSGEVASCKIITVDLKYRDEEDE